MSLNNKGFAITGILYTVFVLFLMILLSVLGGLNIKRSLLEKNIENIKGTLEETCTEVFEVIDSSGFYTEYSGKYTIKVNGTTDYEVYLPEKKSIYINDGLLKIYSSSVSFLGDSPTEVNEAVVVEICTTEKVWESSE